MNTCRYISSRRAAQLMGLKGGFEASATLARAGYRMIISGDQRLFLTADVAEYLSENA